MSRWMGVTKSNQRLIKELIKNDYEIDLNDLKNIDFIMRETKCKTVKDWDKIINYLEEYTEKTKNEGHDYWDINYSFNVYINYLKEFEPIKDKEIFPKEDIHYLTECMRELTYNIEDDFYTYLNKSVRERYQKRWGHIKEMKKRN